MGDRLVVGQTASRVVRQVDDRVEGGALMRRPRLFPLFR
jgi:hypothetical protein